jgi:hypothetical protein
LIHSLAVSNSQELWGGPVIDVGLRFWLAKASLDQGPRHCFTTKARIWNENLKRTEAFTARHHHAQLSGLELMQLHVCCFGDIFHKSLTEANSETSSSNQAMINSDYVSALLTLLYTKLLFTPPYPATSSFVSKASTVIPKKVSPNYLRYGCPC